MVASLLSSAMLVLASAAMPSWDSLLVVRSLLGLTLSGLPAVAMTYLGEEMHAESIGLGMGLYISGSAVGGMGGRLVTGVLTDFFDWRVGVAVVGVIGVACALAFWRALPPSRHFVRQPLDARALAARFGGMFHDRGLPWLFVEGFLLLGAFVTVYNYLGYRLLAPPYNLSQAVVGLIFGIYLIGTFSSAWMGHLAGKLGRRKVLWTTFALMLALGIGGFIGLIVLGAYAPDLKSGRNGGAHALSNAATGFSGLVQLAEATGRHPRIVRDVHEFDTEDLLVVAPETATVNVSAAVQDRGAQPTLFILPKWQTVADPMHRGWVKEAGLKPLFEATGVLAPDINFLMRRDKGKGGQPLMTDRVPPSIRFSAPKQMQVIAALEERKDGPQHFVRPLITDGKGGMVLVQVDDSNLFVLADPDLLSNQGLRDAGKAASALALLDWLNWHAQVSRERAKVTTLPVAGNASQR